MNKRKAILALSILCFVTLMLGLAAILFPPETIAVHNSTETKHITSDGNSNQSKALLTATHSIPDINNTVVALVMQPGQDRIYAFNALTGEWATLGDSNFKVEADDIILVGPEN